MARDGVVGLLRQAASDPVLGNFEIAIGREAQALLSKGITPAEARMILGTVAALSFDVEGFVDHYRVARDLSPDRRIRANFTIMALRLGLFQWATNQATELFHTYQDDVGVIKLAREVGAQSLNFELHFAAVEALEKLNVPPEALAVRFSTRARRMSHLWRERRVKWEEFIQRLDAAASVLREQREPIFDALYDMTPEGRLSYSFAVKADIDTITNINFAIVDRIVNGFDETLADVVTFSCLPARRELLPRRVPQPSQAT